MTENHLTLIKGLKYFLTGYMNAQDEIADLPPGFEGGQRQSGRVLPAIPSTSAHTFSGVPVTIPVLPSWNGLPLFLQVMVSHLNYYATDI